MSQTIAIPGLPVNFYAGLPVATQTVATQPGHSVQTNAVAGQTVIVYKSVHGL